MLDRFFGSSGDELLLGVLHLTLESIDGAAPRLFNCCSTGIGDVWRFWPSLLSRFISIIDPSLSNFQSKSN